MINMIAEPYAGSQIQDCIEQAIQTCGMVYLSPEKKLPSERVIANFVVRAFYNLKLNGEVDGNDIGEVDMTFVFNGVNVTVKADSDPELIYRDWSRALHGYIDKKVGPYPNPVLTDEEKENDARIEAENEQRRQQRQSEYQAQADAKRNATEAKLADAPQMEIADKAAWQSWKDNNQDGYGGAIIAYAERWARLMQVEINAGKKLEDIAGTTSQEADIDGISGAMYGAAVHTLATS